MQKKKSRFFQRKVKVCLQYQA